VCAESVEKFFRRKRKRSAAVANDEKKIHFNRITPMGADMRPP
jgi:hypothetical protein